jgi:hypothetical protein
MRYGLLFNQWKIIHCLPWEMALFLNNEIWSLWIKKSWPLFNLWELVPSKPLRLCQGASLLIYCPCSPGAGRPVDENFDVSHRHLQMALLQGRLDLALLDPQPGTRFVGFISQSQACLEKNTGYTFSWSYKSSNIYVQFGRGKVPCNRNSICTQHLFRDKSCIKWKI